MTLRTASLLAVLLSASARGQTAPQRGKVSAPRGKVAPKPEAHVAPAIRSFTLKNGLRTTLIHVGTARRATVALVLQTGEIDEPAFGPGLAALTANMLLEGSVSRSA